MLTRLAGEKALVSCLPSGQRENGGEPELPGSTLAKPARAGVARGRSADETSANRVMPSQEADTMLKRLRQTARSLKVEAYALYLACRDPRVPWYAKAVAGFVVAHTFSPIDLVPDFIPVLGYLDDLIITPLGIFIALKLIPPEVMAEARRDAFLAGQEGKIRSGAGAAIVLAIWFLGVMLVAYGAYKFVAR